MLNELLTVEYNETVTDLNLFNNSSTARYVPRLVVSELLPKIVKTGNEQ
jgi:hypothetical protein